MTKDKEKDLSTMNRGEQTTYYALLYKKTHSKEVLDSLLASSIGFLQQRAMFYYSRSTHLSIDLNELINEGFIGMLEALKRFDETKGYSFLCYAASYINLHMRNYIVSMSPLSFSTDTWVAMNHANTMHANGKSVEDISQELGRTQMYVNKYLTLQDVLYYNDTASDEPNGSSLLNTIADPNANYEESVISDIDSEILRKHLEQAYTPKERELFYLRAKGVRFQELGDRMGVSRQRVHQMYIKLKKKITRDRFFREAFDTKYAARVS